MKFDFISDIHIDTWTNKKKGDYLNKFLKTLIPDEINKTLLIAGDIGHHNEQNINAIKYLREYYENIVLVHGNHELYMVYYEDLKKYNSDSFSRVAELKRGLSEIDGVHFLDGDTVEIDGIVYGGTSGWHDDAYARKNFAYTSDEVNVMWRDFSDSRWIKHVDGIYFDWRTYSEDQYRRLEHLVEVSDVIITHYIPVWEKMRDIYKNELEPWSTFFHFDGYPLIKKMEGKVWLYGHTHDQYDYEYNGCRFLCNPLGHRHEFFENDWNICKLLPRHIQSYN